MTEVGLFLPQPRQVDRSRIIEYAKRAEAQGLDAVWVGESWGRNSVILLTQMVEATDTIDVGAGILNVYSRSPALLAMTAAGLAEISGGRFHLGVGASGPAVIEGLHGVPFEQPVKRIEEYLAVIDRFLSGDRVSFEGEFVSPSGYHLHPRPSVEVAVFLGAVSPESIDVAGSHADGWLPLMIPLEGLPPRLDRLRDSTAEGTLADVTVAPFVVTCISADEPAECERLARRCIARYLGGRGTAFYRIAVDSGFEAEAEAVRTAWERGDRETALTAVSDPMLEAYAIAGTPERARSQLEAYYARGADCPVAFVPPAAPDSLWQSTINALGDITP